MMANQVGIEAQHDRNGYKNERADGQHRIVIHEHTKSMTARMSHRFMDKPSTNSMTMPCAPELV